ncbi:signal recognition particle 72 kda [Moniliophthora roreri]|uniref:Signal recognition particle subunit SRP72 n=1 Tax=Moniliophthora roreri TaxID=221103 RepID=A0A0W0F0I5_MONRR|nr:signal recognition particle 72 kda [Moniliophthora roreri]
MSSRKSGKSSTIISGKQNKPGEHHKGHKATPKQPVPVPDRLKRLFNSLCAQIDGGHFTNAIKTCDKILRLAPDDPDALQTKLFLYLQTEQYGPALDLVGLGEKGKSGNTHAFEKAYVLYRMQKEERAEEILNEIKEKDENNRGAMHLEAQLCYRQGSYQTAVDLYSQLLDTCEPDSEEHSDILTNLQAAQRHLDFIESGFLRSLDSLPASLRNNIDTLPPPPQQSTSTVAAAIAASNVSTSKESAIPAPKKKVRMSRVPKGVIPGVTPPPDPERWLKKSERSTVQGHGKKKKGGGGGGATQGSAGADYNAPVSGVGGSGGGGKGKGKKKK